MCALMNVFAAPIGNHRSTRSMSMPVNPPGAMPTMTYGEPETSMARPKYLGFPAEPRLPGFVAENSDVTVFVALLVGREEAAERGPHPEHREHTRRHQHGIDRARVGAASTGDRVLPERADRLECRYVVAQRGVGTVARFRKRFSSAARSRHGKVDAANAGGVDHVRRRAKEKRVDRAERRRVGADADSERRDGDRGERRIAAHRTQSVPNVLRDPLESGRGMRVVQLFAHDGRISEGAARLERRVGGAHPAAHESLCLHRDVRLHLGGKVVVGTTTHPSTPPTPSHRSILR